MKTDPFKGKRGYHGDKDPNKKRKTRRKKRAIHTNQSTTLSVRVSTMETLAQRYRKQCVVPASVTMPIWPLVHGRKQRKNKPDRLFYTDRRFHWMATSGVRCSEMIFKWDWLRLEIHPPKQCAHLTQLGSRGLEKRNDLQIFRRARRITTFRRGGRGGAGYSRPWKRTTSLCLCASDRPQNRRCRGEGAQGGGFASGMGKLDAF